MNQGARREFFAGSNSYYGFWSHFESITTSQEMTRLLIKGGPGFGKSTMMKKIGAYFAQKGLFTEWFHCPSDPDSMDAVAIPQAGFCIIDATAPHALVPVRPKDEIVNLWKYWEPNRHGSIQKTETTLDAEIEKTDGKYEKWINQTRQEWETQEKNWWQVLKKEIFYQHMQHEIKQQTQAIEEQFFQDIREVDSNPQPLRHLFAAGLTPDGVVHLSPFIFDQEWKYIALTCCMQPIAENFMKMLAQKCQNNGINAEIYHSPADPRKIDIVALPPFKRAVVLLHSFGIQYKEVIPEAQIQAKIELCESAQCQSHLSFTKEANIQIITDYLQKRRYRHQLVEERYHPAMDFSAIHEETERIIQRFDSI